VGGGGVEGGLCVGGDLRGFTSVFFERKLDQLWNWNWLVTGGVFFVSYFRLEGHLTLCRPAVYGNSYALRGASGRGRGVVTPNRLSP